MTKDEVIAQLNVHHNYIKEKFFKKHFFDNYQEMILFSFPENFSFSQKLWHYLHDDLDFKYGICPECGKRTHFRSFFYGYMTYCSLKCAQNSDEVKSNISTTNIERYGNKCSLNGREQIKKKKETWITNYGVDNPAKAQCVKDKCKNTNIDRRGVDNPMKCKDVQEKSKKTCKEKYGVEYYLQSNDKKEKQKTTCMIHYGVEHPSQADEVKDKKRKTCMKNYGVEYPMQSEVVKMRTSSTCLEKYGVEHVLSYSEMRKNINDTCEKKYGNKCLFKTEFFKNKAKTTIEKRYGVPYACMRPEARNRTNNTKPNKKFIEVLKQHDISYEREFILEGYSYDFKIDKYLIEINPTITHNTYLNIYGGNPLDKEYHFNKSKTAYNHNYICICVWDRTDLQDILDILNNKKELVFANVTKHWYNMKKKEHLIDKGFDEQEMISNGYFPIYDDGQYFINTLK